MKISREVAMARFGTYLEVEVGNYNWIFERLGSYDKARKNRTVDDGFSGADVNTPHPWYFENTADGLEAAKSWALEMRVKKLTTNIWHGVKERDARRHNFVMTLRILRGKLLRDNEFLKRVVEFDAKSEALKDEAKTDNITNIEVERLAEMTDNLLEIGELPEIGDKVWQVTNMQGGVKVEESTVTHYDVYNSYEPDSDVDVRIDAHFGDGCITNDSTQGNYSNRINFVVEAEALEQARVWAQEIVDDNSKWL